MMRNAKALAAIVLALVAAAAGCRSHQLVPRDAAEKCLPVTFDGCGLCAKKVDVAPERLALRDAFAGLEVDPVLSAGGYPVQIFVRLVRPDGEYFIGIELIADTAAGDILLNPGERIELVPWTATDLKRGLNEVAPPTSGLAAAFQLRPLLVFPVDMPYVQKLYAAQMQGRESITLDVAAFDRAGQRHTDPTFNLIKRESIETSFDSRELPRIGNFRLIQGSDVDPVTKKPVNVGVVERTVDGQPMVFMLPLPDPTKKLPPNAPIIRDVWENALVFDGDVITLAPPEAFPIVAASRLVAQEVVQPMVARRRLAERKAMKPPADNGRGGFRIFPDRVLRIGWTP